jgi:hypothetical protein
MNHFVFFIKIKSSFLAMFADLFVNLASKKILKVYSKGTEIFNVSITEREFMISFIKISKRVLAIIKGIVVLIVLLPETNFFV